MQIDWNHFTPWMSLAGGILLGIGSAMFILVNGRILGISGIVGGLLAPKVRDASWRIAFLLGLFASPLAARLLFPSDWISVPRIDAGWGTLVAAGLMVGLGTRYGAGCTSGHGVCGLARFSLRSLAATLIFLGVAILTTYVVRHVLGLAP